MAAHIQQETPDIWKTIIAPDTRAWPPMATNAVGIVTQLKEEKIAITSSAPVVLYFSRLVRLFAKSAHNASLDGQKAEQLKSALKGLVGCNKPLSAFLKQPVQPPEWVRADAYDAKIKSALEAYESKN